MSCGLGLENEPSCIHPQLGCPSYIGEYCARCHRLVQVFILEVMQLRNKWPCTAYDGVHPQSASQFNSIQHQKFADSVQQIVCGKSNARTANLLAAPYSVVVRECQMMDGRGWLYPRAHRRRKAPTVLHSGSAHPRSNRVFTTVNRIQSRISERKRECVDACVRERSRGTCHPQACASSWSLAH